MGADVRKTVTVVFCDVAGSTELGEARDPESVRAVMTRYFDEMRGILERHGGTVEKFIGDAVVAVFGIPTLHEDDALRAVRAAEEMRERIAGLSEELEQEWGAGIAVRIGVSTGEVVAGDPDSGQPVATGDAVNVAARLQGAAEPGDVLLGEETFRLVRDAVTAEPAGPLQLKGKSEPVKVHRLFATTPGAPAFARRLDEVLVGRVEELALLRERFDQAVHEQKAKLVSVLGPPGIGKSRLALELGTSASAEATVLTGRCLDYGEGMSFWPLVEALRELDLEQTLAGEEDAQLVARRIQGVIGRAEAAGAIEETYWAVRRLFEAVARKRPLILVFEDIHWAETAFLDLLEYLAEWTREAPILVLCLARPDLLERRPGWSGERLELGALRDEECSALVDNLLAGSDLLPEARLHVLEAAEGNPLFLEQMAAMLAEDGVRKVELRVPPTIQALLGARLDQLEPEERTVIERASVVGKVFYWGAVAQLCPDDIWPRMAGHLLALIRKGLIGPEASDLPHEDAFRFRHNLIRDAAYQALPKQARAQLHERFAGWLDQRGVEQDEIVGYHLEQAYRYRGELAPVGEAELELARRAGARFAGAGRRAFSRGDVPAAASLLDRAALLLEHDERTRLELLPELGRALLASGELGRAGAVLREAETCARRFGERRLELHAVLEHAWLLLGTDPEGRTEELSEVAERAIPVFRGEGDELGLARAWHLLADARTMRCRFGAALEALEHALVHARRAGGRREEAEIVTWLGTRLFRDPTPVTEALRRCEELLAQARGNPSAEAGVFSGLALLQTLQGRFAEARESYRRCRKLTEDLGMRFRLGISLIFSGEVELLADDPVAAERELRESCEIFEAMGEKSFFSTATARLAEALYAQGRDEEAERCTKLSEETAASLDLLSQVHFRATRAKIVARHGRLDHAERLAREAVVLAETTDSPNLRAGTLMDLTEVLRTAGRPDEAAAALREALALYDRKGNLVSAARARARLAELASEPLV